MQMHWFAQRRAARESHAAARRKQLDETLAYLENSHRETTKQAKLHPQWTDEDIEKHEWNLNMQVEIDHLEALKHPAA